MNPFQVERIKLRLFQAERARPGCGRRPHRTENSNALTFQGWSLDLPIRGLISYIVSVESDSDFL